MLGATIRSPFAPVRRRRTSLVDVPCSHKIAASSALVHATLAARAFVAEVVTFHLLSGLVPGLYSYVERPPLIGAATRKDFPQ